MQHFSTLTSSLWSLWKSAAPPCTFPASPTSNAEEKLLNCRKKLSYCDHILKYIYVLFFLSQFNKIWVLNFDRGNLIYKKNCWIKEIKRNDLKYKYKCNSRLSNLCVLHLIPMPIKTIVIVLVTRCAGVTIFTVVLSIRIACVIIDTTKSLHLVAE